MPSARNCACEPPSAEQFTRGVLALERSGSQNEGNEVTEVKKRISIGHREVLSSKKNKTIMSSGFRKRSRSARRRKFSRKRKRLPLALKTHRMLRRYMKKEARSTELKWLTDFTNITDIDDAGTDDQYFFQLGQGSTQYQREGTSVTCKHFRLNIGFKGPIYSAANNATPVGAIVRYLIYYDKKPELGAPSYSDLIYNPIHTDRNVYKFRNIDNVDRFKVLRDGMFAIPPQSEYGGNKVMRFDLLRNGKLVWNRDENAPDAYADMHEGGVGIVLCSDVPTASHSDLKPKYVLEAKLAYTDK